MDSKRLMLCSFAVKVREACSTRRFWFLNRNFHVFCALDGLCVAARTLIPYPHRVVKPKMSHLSREKLDLVNRTKKIVGQLEGVERALNEDEPCMDVLQRLSAARGAINSLMGELMEDHIRNHMPRKTKSSEEAADDLIEIVRTYLK
jgi:FrmR/RcnR family transcriptional regulator, repressor of rcnA expression